MLEGYAIGGERGSWGGPGLHSYFDTIRCIVAADGGRRGSERVSDGSPGAGLSLGFFFGRKTSCILD